MGSPAFAFQNVIGGAPLWWDDRINHFRRIYAR
jgi:hypothetical protein